jgi:hypothetical protein
MKKQCMKCKHFDRWFYSDWAHEFTVDTCRHPKNMKRDGTPKKDAIKLNKKYDCSLYEKGKPRVGSHGHG